MSIIALALLAAVNSGAAPQEPPRAETRTDVRVIDTRGPGGRGPLDADGDGVITREEFAAPMGSAFDRLDANRDGRLGADELAAERGSGPGGPGAPGVMFVGGPGGLGGPGGAQVVMVSRDGPDGGRPLSGGPGLHPAPGSHQVFVRRVGGPDGPGQMDKNGDGKVSQDEFLAPMIEAFGQMDADHNGFLDDGEGHPTPPPPPHAD